MMVGEVEMLGGLGVAVEEVVINGIAVAVAVVAGNEASDKGGEEGKVVSVDSNVSIVGGAGNFG